jgi:SOS response associated peptidase (SRAP)
MCGRVIQSSGPLRYGVLAGMDPRDTRVHNYPPRWNAAPSQELLVIRRNHETGQVSLDPLRWGLVPYWCKDPKGGRKPINAKGETVRDLPTFRDASRMYRTQPRDSRRTRARAWRELRGAEYHDGALVAADAARAPGDRVVIEPAAQYAIGCPLSGANRKSFARREARERGGGGNGRDSGRLDTRQPRGRRGRTVKQRGRASAASQHLVPRAAAELLWLIVAVFAQLTSLVAIFAPLMTSLVAMFAPLMTSLAAMFAPLMTSLVAGLRRGRRGGRRSGRGGLGLSIGHH